MHQKLLKSAHYIELGSYQYWPVLVPRGIRLYTYEQIPVSLKDNPYITDGYRAYLPSRLCIKRYRLAASHAPAAPPPHCPVFVWSSRCCPCPFRALPCHLSAAAPACDLPPCAAGLFDPPNNNDSDSDPNDCLWRFAVYKGLLHLLFLVVLAGLHVGLTPLTMVEPYLPLCVYLSPMESQMFGVR